MLKSDTPTSVNRRQWLFQGALHTAGLLSACCGLTHCHASEDTAAAEKAVTDFHAKLDLGGFHTIYAESDPLLKQNTPEPKLVTFLEAVHRKLGVVKKTTRTGWNFNTSTSGTDVTLTYHTTFAEGEGTERFSYRIHGGRPSLLGYRINSNEMMIK